jgi:hypothetical protein
MALQRIETDGIEDDAITTNKIAPNAVAAADIAADAITNVKVAAGAAIAVSKITGLGTAAALNVGTSASNVVQLDGSARLPAVSGANLTGVSTDTSAMENNIAILAFKTQSANNLAKFNLVDQVIDEYKDGTGATYTTAGQTGTTATTGYVASVVLSATKYAVTSGMLAHTSLSSFNAGQVVDGTTGAGGGQGFYVASATTSGEMRVDLGSGVSASFAKIRSYVATATNSAVWTIAYSDNGSAWTNTSLTTFAPGASSYNAWFEGTWANVGAHRYWKMFISSGNGGSQGWVGDEIEWYAETDNATGTAISTANTALTAPTTGDIVLLIENATGTATLNTHIKAYVSRNGGTGWDQSTLVDKGSWGTNKKILTANNVAFSNSASGTDMRYKIEWAGQAAATRVTKVHATSLAWA